jgi:hypothetical protein
VDVAQCRSSADPAGRNVDDENCTILSATKRNEQQNIMNTKIYDFRYLSAFSELRYHQPLHRFLNRVNRSLSGGRYGGGAILARAAISCFSPPCHSESLPRSILRTLFISQSGGDFLGFNALNCARKDEPQSWRLGTVAHTKHPGNQAVHRIQKP